MRLDIAENYALPREVAEALYTTERTLRRWRTEGIGPPWAKIGHLVLYPRAGLREWVDAQVKTPPRSQRRAA